MKASLFFNNKKYILVKEASSLTGYSKIILASLPEAIKLIQRKFMVFGM